MKTIIRENTTNKPSTTIKTTIATLIGSLIISSCGGSNGNKGTPNQGDTPNGQTPVTQPGDKKPPKDNEEPPKNGEEIKFKIQANGPIKGANITIQTLDGNIIYSGITTNNNGEITINKTQLTKALELHNIEPNTHIEIIAQGGTDINGINTDNQKYETQKEQIQQEINGTITAILSSTNINNSIITPLSKNIQILLSGENGEKTENYYINGKINTEKINQQILKILKTLGVVDINKDGKIDNKDITQYDMQKYESKLEQQIKQNGFLKSIYTGKKENRETHIINQLIQLGEINTNNIELPQTTNGEIEQIQETEKKPPIGDSQNKQTTETYTTKTVTGVNQEEVNALTSELDTLKTNLNNTENNLDNQQTQLTTIQNNLTQTDTSLTTSYNNSDQTTKTLANKNYTTTEKEQAINDKITTQIKIAINTQNNYGTPPKETQQTITDKITKESINDGKQILTNKITILKQEIGPLKQKVEEKKEAYDKKYEEYLQAKEEYEEAQRLFKYRDDKYTTLKQEVKDLESDVISYRRKKNLADDEYLKIKIPKTSNYPVSSYKNTNYKNKITTVKKLVFTYRGYDIKGYFKFSSEGGFPGKLWVEKDNSKMGDDTDINSPTHLNDIDDLIKQAIQYKLDYEYNDDKLDETQKQLDQKIKDRDDAEENRFLYGLIKWVDEEYCEIEEEEYNSAKNEYDIENNKLQKKLTLLEKYKTQLIALQNLLTNLNNYTIQEENTQEEITTIKEELNQLKQEKTAKETALEKAQKGEEREVIEKHITHTEEIPIRTKKIQIAIKIPKENKNPEEIKEEIKQKIEEIKLLIENNTKEITKIVTYKGETILLTTMVVYYTDGENKYPAMIWGDYTAFGLTRETKAYTIDEVYPGEGDGAIGHFKNKILEDVNNLELSEYQKLDKQDEGNLFEYKTIIHTDLKNQQTRYPAKVGIIYKIGGYEYREYSNIEVVNKQEETQELQKLISIKQGLYYEEGGKYINSIRVESQDGINKSKVIWWNGEYIEMIGGAYRIFKVPDGNKQGYVATWKVANLGEWHIGAIWNNKEALIKEVLRIMDEWVKRNENSPIYGENNENEYDDTEWGGEGEITFEPIPEIITYENLKQEYNELYLKIGLNIEEQNKNPITGVGSIDEYKQEQLDFKNVNYFDTQEFKQIKKVLTQTILLHRDALYSTYNMSKGFLHGYSKAVYDISDFITNLSIMDVDKIGKNLINSGKKGKEYISNVGAYWSASIGYLFNRDEANLQLKNELADKLSLETDIREIEQIINEIDWEYIENADYWAGYLSGYLAENMIVGYGIDKGVRGISKMGLANFDKLISKIKLTSKINETNKLSSIDILSVKIRDLNLSKGLNLGSINGFEYRFQQKVENIKKHIRGFSEYTEDKSYFHTNDLNEVLIYHIEAMSKVPKDVFNKNIGTDESVLIEMGRNIGVYKLRDLDVSTMRIIIKKDGAIHGFPDVQNGTEIIY